jgi:hypothetical protein
MPGGASQLQLSDDVSQGAPSVAEPLIETSHSSDGALGPCSPSAEPESYACCANGRRKDAADLAVGTMAVDFGIVAVSDTLVDGSSPLDDQERKRYIPAYSFVADHEGAPCLSVPDACRRT